MINDIKVIKLNVFSNENGNVRHMVKSTDPFFNKFGEIYFSEIFPGKVKAWSRKKSTTRHYAVVSGEIKLVLSDGIETSEFILGPENYQLIIIPPGVWSGFKSVNNQKAIIADLTDFPYSPEDDEKINVNEIKYNWNY
ncbi:MAG: WxcM-like domain-containing protein [Nanoarchaeota archaeon]